MYFEKYKFAFEGIMKKSIIGLLALTILVFSCKKTEDISVDGNQAPDYNKIPTIIVENYVNRLFIDMLGREATNVERNAWVDSLKLYDLSFATRDKLIRLLQNDSSYRVGDSSYRHAYYQRLYDLSKARFMEGATDGEISQFIGNINFGITIARLEGDSVSVFSLMAEKAKYENVLKSKRAYRIGAIGYAEMCAAMLNNAIYDQINMNSFNFVQASFDDLFGRYPTQDEFKRAYDIIEKNIPSELFGKWAANKNEYCKVLTESSEFYEAQIRWAYFMLLQRQPTPQEVINLYSNFATTKNLQEVQRNIARSDEYAQFKR